MRNAPDAVSRGNFDFTAKDKMFLELYAQTLDLKQAKKESGITTDRLNSNPFLLTQVDRITQLNMYSIQAKTIIGTHYRLMEKFEQDYDEAKVEGDSKLQQGLASTLSRMTDTAMKASGEFFPEKEQQITTAVQVVINMGTQQEKKEADVDPIEQQIVDVIATTKDKRDDYDE